MAKIDINRHTLSRQPRRLCCHQVPLAYMYSALPAQRTSRRLSLVNSPWYTQNIAFGSRTGGRRRLLYLGAVLFQVKVGTDLSTRTSTAISFLGVQTVSRTVLACAEDRHSSKIGTHSNQKDPQRRLGTDSTTLLATLHGTSESLSPEHFHSAAPLSLSLQIPREIRAEPACGAVQYPLKGTLLNPEATQ